MVDNQKISAVRVFRAVSLLDKKILTARIAFGRQIFSKINLKFKASNFLNYRHVDNYGRW